MFPAVFNLNDINGKNGFSFSYSGSQLRQLVAGGTFTATAVGDVNGDGINDIFTDTSGGFPMEDNMTISYGRTLWNATYNPTTETEHGYQIFHSEAFAISANGLSDSNCDINGDGLKDVPFNTGSNLFYIVYGSKTLKGSINLSTLDGKNGFIANYNYLATETSVYAYLLNDINGDGIDEMMFLSLQLNSVWFLIAFGNKSGFPSVLNVTTFMFTGNTGLKIVVTQCLGGDLVSMGDINGDGLNDFAVNAEDAIIFFGSKIYSSPFTIPDQITKSNGFVISLPGAGTEGVGDVNGDGIDDFVVNWYDKPNMVSNIFFGSRVDGYFNSVDFSNAKPGTGFSIAGLFGAGVGDVNGDGYDDLAGVNSNPSANGDGPPSLIYYGSGSISALTPALADGVHGFSFAPLDQNSGVIDAFGDINGDNIADLLVKGEDNNYIVVFGEKGPTPPTPTPTPQPTPDDGLSAGAIGGIVGGILGAAVLAGFAWYGKIHGWCCGEKHLAGTEAPLLTGE